MTQNWYFWSVSRSRNAVAADDFPLLVKAPDGRLVAPGSVVQEEAPTGEKVTVDIPKNLPQMPSDAKK